MLQSVFAHPYQYSAVEAAIRGEKNPKIVERAGKFTIELSSLSDEKVIMRLLASCIPIASNAAPEFWPSDPFAAKFQGWDWDRNDDVVILVDKS